MQEAALAEQRYFTLLIIGIALPLLLYPFFSVLFLSPTQSLVYRMVCSRFLIWAELGLMILYARQGEVQRFMLWDEQKHDFTFYFSFIVLLFLLFYAGGMIARIPYWFGLREKNDMVFKMHAIMNKYPVLMVFTVITAGITEELIFRGYMIPRLSLLFTNKHPPVIISSLLFSFIHLGYKSIAELIFTFLFGLSCGYVYQRYRNIRVLIVAHSLWDLMVFMLAHQYHHK